MSRPKKSYLTYLLLGILLAGIIATVVILLLANRSPSSFGDSPQPENQNNVPPVPPSKNNNKYVALAPTQQEPEYKVIPHLPISAIGTDYSMAIPNHLPAGSAILTDTLDGSGGGSSTLNSKGITHIIHACPKPRSSFSNDQDFINCIVKSVQNSIILADRNNFEKLAIPFVGGGTYLGNCDPQKLAEGIVKGAIN